LECLGCLFLARFLRFALHIAGTWYGIGGALG
jgi:hypothetical protein